MSCVTRIRSSRAAQARKAGSSAPMRPASWILTMSRLGFRLKRPRRMSLLKFSSAAKRSMVRGHGPTESGAARQQSLSDAPRIELGFIQPASLLGLPFLAREVGFDLGPATEVVA